METYVLVKPMSTWKLAVKTEKERERERERERETDRQTDRQTDRDRERPTTADPNRKPTRRPNLLSCVLEESHVIGGHEPAVRNE